jgi:DNA topoisomerase VI subunit B
MNEAIVVSSHVARDFLQNSAYFSTPAKVVWEYVSNSLDAARDDVQTQVDVEVTSHEIRVADNGRGMSRSELGAFFQMHGENEARRHGKPVRGMFGTGKCAAFGIAKSMQITTVQSGLENVVELRRSDIDSAQDGGKFPVRHLVADLSTSQQSGTVIQITDFGTRRLDVDGVIVYVQKPGGCLGQRAAVPIQGTRLDQQHNTASS